MDILEPPIGCIETPGFILVIEPGKTWLRKDLTVTNIWAERGIWEAAEDAEAARNRLPD
ncbi:MAG: hypothetical protein WC856_07960 [Methylococcaceae bacterium]|jgi:hypothetical protein